MPDVTVDTADRPSTNLDGAQADHNNRDANFNPNKPRTGDLDLNMIGSNGFNCLHAACGSGNIEMVEYLLSKRKVNPNERGKDNWSPLEIAVQSGLIEIVSELLSDERLRPAEAAS